MPGAIYSWEEWFGKNRVTLRRGKHYFVPQSSFVQQVRQAASKRGLRIRVEDRETEVVIRVLERAS